MRRIFFCGLWLLLIGWGASSGQARETWLYSQSDHFELLSSASEWEARKMLVDLEQFRASFLATIHLSSARDPRATVVLFDSDRQFDRVKPLYKGKPTDARGYCAGSRDETVIALIAGEAPAETREVIFHEYVHLLLHSHELPVPPWLNEGLAELYSTFEIENGVVRFGQAKPRHLALLRQNELMHLGELFAVQHSSHTYNEGPERSLFYAESWALVHFWLCGEDQSYRPGMIRFMTLLDDKNKKPPQACFEEAFGIGYEEMERRFNRYLNGGAFLVRGAKVALPDYGKKLVFRPATDFERDVALENLRYRLRHTADSEYKLIQLAEQNPTSPRPYEILAAISMYDNEPRLAMDRWRKAGELGSSNSFVYVQLANEVVRQMRIGVSLNYRIPEKQCAELREWLDRAIKLSPEYWEAYDTLAFVEAFSTKPRGGAVNAIQASITKMKDAQRTLMSLAVIRWRINDYATSEAILDVLDKKAPNVSPDKILAAKLRKQLAADRAKREAADPSPSMSSESAEVRSAESAK